MKTHSLLLLPSLLIVSQLSIAAIRTTSNPLDSIGVERRDGRRYVLHRVDQGQTLYGVARRYKTSVDAIRTANPDLGTGSVRYDQLLRVPVGETPLTKKEQRVAEKIARKEEKAAIRQEETYKAKPAKAETPAAEPTTTATPARPAAAAPIANPGTHVVETGQTLYSLAARYGVTMADLRRWNNIGTDGIQVGQTLITSEKAYEARPVTSRNADTKTKPVANVAKVEAKPMITPEPPLAPGTKPKPKPSSTTETTAERPTERTQPRTESRAEPAPEPVRPAPPKATEPKADNEPVAASTRPRSSSVKVQSEIGFADIIEGDSPSSKYLALHRSAPVGTLVQVRNDISNQTLYVKVVGKLPDTGLNDQVLIRLSSRAFEKLSPNGQRFRAEVSYTK